MNNQIQIILATKDSSSCRVEPVVVVPFLVPLIICIWLICQILPCKERWLSPALANSTSSLGSVAENSRLCLLSGSLRMISVSCSAKPISNSLEEQRGGEG